MIICLMNCNGERRLTDRHGPGGAVRVLVHDAIALRRVVGDDEERVEAAEQVEPS